MIHVPSWCCHDCFHGDLLLSFLSYAEVQMYVNKPGGGAGASTGYANGTVSVMGLPPSHLLDPSTCKLPSLV